MNVLSSSARTAGFAISGGRLAHGWGFAEHRASDPWLPRTRTARRPGTSRFVPAERVTDRGREWYASMVTATLCHGLHDEENKQYS